MIALEKDLQNKENEITSLQKHGMIKEGQRTLIKENLEREIQELEDSLQKEKGINEEIQDRLKISEL